MPADPLTTATGAPKIPAMTSVSSLFTWLGTKGDYESIERKNLELKGWRRHFSTCTKEGRLNYVIVTYLASGLLGLYLWKHFKQARPEKTASVSE